MEQNFLCTYYPEFSELFANISIKQVVYIGTWVWEQKQVPSGKYTGYIHPGHNNQARSD